MKEKKRVSNGVSVSDSTARRLVKCHCLLEINESRLFQQQTLSMKNHICAICSSATHQTSRVFFTSVYVIA